MKNATFSNAQRSFDRQSPPDRDEIAEWLSSCPFPLYLEQEKEIREMIESNIEDARCDV